MQTNHAMLPYYDADEKILKPQAYCSSPYGGVIAAPAHSKTRGSRTRINALPIAIALLVPWLLFCLIYGTLSFTCQYNRPVLCWTIVVGTAVAIVLLAIFAIDTHKKRTEAYIGPRPKNRDSTWIIFIFLACSLQWTAGLIAGDVNYYSNMKPYYNFLELNSYLQVDPSMMRGQQLMDGGRVVFDNTTRVDVTKAMGFRNTGIFCVAPITNTAAGDSTKLATYDFWAVGKDCCLGDSAAVAGTDAGFRCGSYNEPGAHGGLRLMSDGDRPFYRLAVQQAEAAYGIKAEHPLFFTWMADPFGEIDNLGNNGERQFFNAAGASFIVQMTFVFASALAFSKLARQ